MICLHYVNKQKNLEGLIDIKFSTKKNKRGVFRKLYISYLLIGAIPLIVLGTLFYYFNVIDYEKNVKEANLAKLIQVKNQVDIDLKVLKDVTYHISSNQQILNGNTAVEEFKKSEIVSQLEAYKKNGPFLDDILLYYRGDKNTYTTNGYYYYYDFETNVKKDLNWSGFFTKLNTVISPKIMRINSKETESSLSNKDNFIVLMYPVPYLSKLPLATVVYTIKESEILSKFDTFIGDFKGHVFIYDNQNNLLVSDNNGYNGEDKEFLSSQINQYKGTGIFDIASKNNRYVLMRTVSEETGWNYVVAMSSYNFFKSVNAMRFTVILVVFALILTGLILAYVLSNNNYGPIKTLISFIKNQDIQPVQYDGTDELEMIRYSFENNYNKNRELIVQVDAQRQFVRDQCLIRILRGKVKDIKELDYLLKCSNIQLNGTGFFTMVLSAEINNKPELDLDKVYKLLEDISFIGARGYGVELAQEKTIAIIVNIEKDCTDFRDIQSSIVGEVSTLVNKILDFEPVIGVGNVFKDIMQLNTSFLEASSVLYESAKSNGSKSIFYNDIKESQHQVYWYAITEQALFIQSLKQGDKTVAAEVLKSITASIKEKNPSYYMVRCICFDILNNIIKSISNMNIGSFSGDINQLAKFETLDEFIEGMGTFSVKICDYFDDFKESRNNELKNNIIKYVNDNFTSVNISLDDVARKFDLSSTYVSGFFKNETGVNFIEYITNLRMDFIKGQLLNTDKSIKDIATEAGYIDAASFTRKFRLIEGITPGQYRKMSENNS